MVSYTESDRWRVIGWYVRGTAARGAGDDVVAAEAFDTCLGLPGESPEKVQAACERADLAFAAGDLAMAARRYGEAAEWASSDAMLDLRARSYFGLGRVAESREDWADAARRFMSVGILFDDPALTPEALYRAAEAFGRSGKPAEQGKALDELKERYPESEWASGNGRER